MTTTDPRPTTARPRVALRDRVLKLVEFATTPLLPSDYLDLIDPLRSGADLRGRIEAVLPETRDAATLVIRPGPRLAGRTAPASTSGSASTSTASASGGPTR